MMMSLSTELTLTEHRRRIAALEEGLRRALRIIDSPRYRDAAGLRPNAHPGVMDLRELVK
jgi:hypothetical protein